MTPSQRERAERLAEALGGESNSVALRNSDEAAALLRELLTHADEDARDAGRYRKWRDDYTDHEGECSEMLLALADAWSPGDVDTAIDAAIAAQEKP